MGILAALGMKARHILQMFLLEAAGLGLAGIQERLASLSGKMSIESDPGRGTRIIMEVPAR